MSHRELVSPPRIASAISNERPLDLHRPAPAAATAYSTSNVPVSGKLYARITPPAPSLQQRSDFLIGPDGLRSLRLVLDLEHFKLMAMTGHDLL